MAPVSEALEIPDGGKKTASSLTQLYASQIKGKVILTTGVSLSGLGAMFLKAISRAEPSLLILAGRNITKVEETARDLLKHIDENRTTNSKSLTTKVRIVELDLSSLETVRAAAREVHGWADVPKIDVLVNNAGIMAVPYSLTVDGYESQFATNHLGPFLFTNLIMDKILASSAPRIVMHGETYNKWQAYGQSKTANMLMALSLAQKLGTKHNLLAFSLHPGNINTNIGDHIDWNVEFPALRKLKRAGKKSTVLIFGIVEVHRFFGNPNGWKTSFPFVSHDEGAATHVFATFAPDIQDFNGVYLEDCRVADPWTDRVKPWATNSIDAEKLWKLSEELVHQSFNYT